MITSEVQETPSKFAKELITSTIENHAEGVFTTINSDGTPSSSVITLHKLEDYTYFFMTKDTTKKYDNLEFNPNISYLVFDPFSRTELEIKGLTEFIWDEHTRKHALKIIEKDRHKGRGHISPFVATEDSYALFTIHPQSIHFTTYWDKGDGPEIYRETIEFTVKDTDYPS